MAEALTKDVSDHLHAVPGNDSVVRFSDKIQWLNEERLTHKVERKKEFDMDGSVMHYLGKNIKENPCLVPNLYSRDCADYLNCGIP